MKKGFTLIELLIVIGIIALMTAIALPHYRAGERQFALQRSAHQLVQDLRRTKEMAMSAREIPGAPATFRGAYGIRFIKNSSSYILFADLNNNQKYDAHDKRIETLNLEKGVKVSSLSPSSPLTVIFAPPDPTVVFQPDWAEIISITISTKDGVINATISVNSVGLIAIE